MIKNIIFDLGNVLITFKPKDFMSRVIPDNQCLDSFVKKVTGSKLWIELDRGSLTVKEAKEILFNKYPEDNEQLTYFFENWFDMFATIQKNIEVLKSLKNNGYKTYVLSSFIKEAFVYVSNRFEFFSLFDGKVISYQEGFVKPESEIYKILLKRYNLIPEESIFIDDNDYILEPAKKLGIKTIHCQPETDLELELRKLNVNI